MKAKINTTKSSERRYFMENSISSKFPMIGLSFFIALFMSLTVSAQYITDRPDWAGIWINTANKSSIDLQGLQNEIAGEAGRISWSNIEPTQGNFNFSDLLMTLQRAKAGGYYYYFVLWTGPNAPTWIYNTVPQVITTDPEEPFPYYLDPDYKLYMKNLFNGMANYLAGIDTSLTNRLAFIQPGFGATGDRQLYKGTPVDSQYNISDAQYVAFMQEMTNEFVSAFTSRPQTANIKFLFNIDDYDGDPVIANPNAEEMFGKWIKEKYSCQLRKQQYTIAVGDLSPNEVVQDIEQRDNFFGNTGRWGGNPEFVRGELNEGETAITPYYQLNTKAFYYWTAISSVDRGLDAWEVKYNTLSLDNREAFNFSHRYSFYKRADKSPYAFVALRDVLDYSDKVRFPEAQYGSATKSNESRVNSILSAYSAYGAKNDDMNAALTKVGVKYLKGTTGYNDCLWDVIARNNQRFITQIKANETSSGYWRVGFTQTQPYGRFCRGFDVAKNKNTMYFDVDDTYFEANRKSGDGNIKIKIIYYAKDSGSWELKYHAKNGSMKTALAVTNNTSQDWVTTEVTLNDALLNNGGVENADIILQNTGATNCKFHLIELERMVVNSSTSVNYIEKNLNNNPLIVYPNPAKSSVYIEFDTNNESTAISIADIADKILFKKTLKIQEST